MAEKLFVATLQLTNGTIIKGPVTSIGGDEYLFVNKSSDLDFYFQLKKDDYKWQFSWGPNIEIPIDYIKQIGRQIDLFHHSPESIEIMADNLLHKFVSQANSNSLYFEFIMLPNTPIRAYYDKLMDDGKLYWQMQRFELL